MLPFTFLLCSERSGSNLITRLLDSHPAFCGPSPTHLIRIMSKNLQRYGNLQHEPNWHHLTADAARVLQSQLGRWLTETLGEELRQRVPEQTLGALVRYVYEKEARAHGKEQLFVKENHAHSLLVFLLSAFPESRYVFLVRDPRDMALSYKTTLSHTGGVSEATRIWLHDQQASLEAYSYLRQTNQMHLLRYEDLVKDPEATLQPLCRFLGVAFEPAMLTFHQDPLTQQNAGRLQAWQNLGRPLLAGNTGKFKTGLSELEIRFVEAQCAAEMKLFGYEAAFAPATDPESLTQKLLQQEAAQPRQVEEPGPEEAEIRARRQEAIRQVLSRKPAGL